MKDLPDARSIWHGCLFIAAYVVCDILSGPEARYQTIAPVWHPAAGLAACLAARRGLASTFALLAAALLAATITPALPSDRAMSLLVGLLPVPVYLAVGLFMRRYLPGGAFIATHRGMLMWAAAATLASLAAACLYASVLHGLGSAARGAWTDTLTRYTIAEVAGILVTVPAACILLDRQLRADYLRRILQWDTAAYTALTALVLSVALQRPAPEALTYYLLILPLAWAAARQGMAGALTAVLVLEVSVTVTALRPIAYPAQMPDVQMLVLTLTLSGFLIGIAVDVARRASDELRQSLRLAAAGEMAAALAHELNQPLTALSVYGSACQRLVERNGGDPLLQKTVASMAAESQRASNVLKRLREFFRTGSLTLERLSLPELIHASVAPFLAQSRAEHVSLQVNAIPDVELTGDRIQLEIVLRNLLSNALQALADLPEGADRRLTVDAGIDGAQVWIRIADNGPGIADKIRARLFEPFMSMKSSGLGLGLAISKAIVETHGGTLAVEPGRHTVLRIALPAQWRIEGGK
ncbi:sensor histidine kinase [Pseudoduganella sp. GCM10020061]|uniref:sensor histidine kinase n=1 Tax=Pseudoduganella sp. GCM10020061 TaxID=3317345 RepID=UPI0036258668